VTVMGAGVIHSLIRMSLVIITGSSRLSP